MTRPQAPQTTHRIALLFNANKVYDREIITGIGNYLLSTRVAWDLFLEEDFRCRLAGIEHFVVALQREVEFLDIPAKDVRDAAGGTRPEDSVS